MLPINYAHLLLCSSALINIVSNALDAIKSAGRRGLLELVLDQHGDTVTLAFD